MFEEFESGIIHNDSDDYWYDDGLFYYQKMLDSFSEEDWKALCAKIGDYPEKAQMRCAECLSDIKNRNSMLIILKISETKNRELFVTCVDSLRNMDISSLSQSEKERLLQRVNAYSADAASPERAVLKAFVDAVGY